MKKPVKSNLKMTTSEQKTWQWEQVEVRRLKPSVNTAPGRKQETEAKCELDNSHFDLSLCFRLLYENAVSNCNVFENM